MPTARAGTNIRIYKKKIIYCNRRRAFAFRRHMARGSGAGEPSIPTLERRETESLIAKALEASEQASEDREVIVGAGWMAQTARLEGKLQADVDKIYEAGVAAGQAAIRGGSTAKWAIVAAARAAGAAIMSGQTAEEAADAGKRIVALALTTKEKQERMADSVGGGKLSSLLFVTVDAAISAILSGVPTHVAMLAGTAASVAAVAAAEAHTNYPIAGSVPRCSHQSPHRS